VHHISLFFAPFYRNASIAGANSYTFFRRKIARKVADPAATTYNPLLFAEKENPAAPKK
jgi:hypothetical protein